MTVIPFRPTCLTDADVSAVRPRILDMIRDGKAGRWNLDMTESGYTALTVVDGSEGVLYSITKACGAYRVTGPIDRPIVETRRLENVIACLN